MNDKHIQRLQKHKPITKIIGSRAFMTLKLLAEQAYFSMPMRDVWHTLHKTQLGSDDGYDNFSDITMGRYERLGWIKRIKLPNNRVLIILTQFGFDMYTYNSTPEKYTKIRIDQLKRYMHGTGYRRHHHHGPMKWLLRDDFDKAMQVLVNLTEGIDKKKLYDLLAWPVGSMFGEILFDAESNLSYAARYHNDRPSRENEDYYNKRVKEKKELEEKIPPAIELLSTLVENSEEFKADMTLHKDNTYEEAHRRDAGLERATIIKQPTITCMFCGIGIHVKESITDAKQIEKHTGKKTGVLCCQCNANVQWAEKYLHFDKVIRVVENKDRTADVEEMTEEEFNALPED